MSMGRMRIDQPVTSDTGSPAATFGVEVGDVDPVRFADEIDPDLNVRCDLLEHLGSHRG